MRSHCEQASEVEAMVAAYAAASAAEVTTVGNGAAKVAEVMADLETANKAKEAAGVAVAAATVSASMRSRSEGTKARVWSAYGRTAASTWLG